MNAFDYRAPRTVDEALAILREYGEDARVIAGGTALVWLHGAKNSNVAPLPPANEPTRMPVAAAAVIRRPIDSFPPVPGGIATRPTSAPRRIVWICPEWTESGTARSKLLAVVS